VSLPTDELYERVERLELISETYRDAETPSLPLFAALRAPSQ
jgi:hypothetical protein